jgi:VCBS repeat-containing protein
VRRSLVSARASVTDFSAVGAAIQGQYGRLTINADGSYSYTRNAGTPGGVTDVFTYRLTDGDGDVATATLTFAIGDSGVGVIVPSAGDDGTLVDEAGLPERDNGDPGSRAGDDSNITFGVVGFEAPDGPATITINGVVITDEGQAIELANGTLYIIGITPNGFEYAYVLTDNSVGTATETISVTVTDRDGDSVTSSFVIDIADDAPSAVADTDSIAAGTYGPRNWQCHHRCGRRWRRGHSGC